MSKTFNQADWGKVGGISMAASGCGPCALASIAYNKDTGINPTKTATWLHKKGVFSSAGTTRAGMTSGINNYGFECDYYKPEHAGGSVWKTVLEKMKNLTGDWWAIFLVVGKANGGKDNLWTSGGHFLAITDYSNGKLYVRDSGSKHRTGYYDPETLRYDTNCIWIIRKKETKTTYNGAFPELPAKGCLKKGDTGEQVKYLQLFLNWYGGYGLAADKSFGEKTKAALKAFQKSEGLTVDCLFGPACLARAKAVKR